VISARRIGGMIFLQNSGRKVRMAQIEEIISRDYHITGSGRYLKTIEHSSLVIDTEKQVFYWNSRDISGDVYDWLSKIKGLTRHQISEYLQEHSPNYLRYLRNVVTQERKDIVVNDALIDSFYNLGRQHREYWTDTRGYTNTTIDLFQLGYTGEWYTIPIFVDGKFRNFQCRKPDGKMKSWYRDVGPLPFNIDYVKNKSWFCLTEGPVDAIMLMQHGIPAMSTNTGAGYFDPLWISKINGCKRMFIVYDNDKAGRRGAVSVGEKLGALAKIYTFGSYADKYDVTDYFKNGGNAKELTKMFYNESKFWFEVKYGMAISG
jgi:DNA primase